MTEDDFLVEFLDNVPDSRTKVCIAAEKQGHIRQKSRRKSPPLKTTRPTNLVVEKKAHYDRRGDQSMMTRRESGPIYTVTMWQSRTMLKRSVTFTWHQGLVGSEEEERGFARE